MEKNYFGNKEKYKTKRKRGHGKKNTEFSISSGRRREEIRENTEAAEQKGFALTEDKAEELRSDRQNIKLEAIREAVREKTPEERAKDYKDLKVVKQLILRGIKEGFLLESDYKNSKKSLTGLRPLLVKLWLAKESATEDCDEPEREQDMELDDVI